MKRIYFKNKRGFTLVELMVAVTIISILSGVMFSLLNQNRQRERAQDSVDLANLTKAATAIESYYYAEGKVPVIQDADNGNPLNNDSNIALDNYLVDVWPENFVYISDGSTDFAIYVQRSINDDYYKFISSEATVFTCAADTANLENLVTACDEVEE